MNKKWNFIISIISILVLVFSIIINNIKLDDVIHMVNDESGISHVTALSKNKEFYFYEHLISSSSYDLNEEYRQAYELKEMKDYSDKIEHYNQLDKMDDINFQ